jgi:cell division septal protein FtsQ
MRIPLYIALIKLCMTVSILALVIAWFELRFSKKQQRQLDVYNQVKESAEALLKASNGNGGLLYHKKANRKVVSHECGR